MQMSTRGQTLLEYIILIGIVTMVLFYMGPAFKRGVQSLVKISADQIGNQQDSDQKVQKPLPQQNPTEWDISSDDTGGYLVGSNSTMNSMIDDTATEREYVTNRIFDERLEVRSESKTDMGYTKE
jgi:hypothetical protein